MVRTRRLLAPLFGSIAAVCATALAVTVVPGVAVADPGTEAARPQRPRVQTGFEVLMAEDYRLLKGKKVGLVSNPTGVLPDQRHVVDVMAAAKDKINLTAVFGPEHGFRGTGQAGDGEGNFVDPRTKLTVYDAYRKSIPQLTEMFTKAGVDVVMFDIQDVGARFYTYIWLLRDSMAAAAAAGKEFVVLDRPNPLGGVQASGPVLDPKYRSGVGQEPIAEAHGMTVGELAGLYNAQYLPKLVGKQVKLTVVKMRGWQRGMDYEATGLPWVPPSPNMPTPDTAFVYPGTGLFEGVNMSEGRGTTRPFEMIGAPYADYHWSDELNAQKLPGVRFREAYFLPTFGPYMNKTMSGVQIVVTDRRRFDSVRTAVALMVTAKKLYPDSFGWRADNWIDKMSGSDWLRTSVDAGRTTDQIVAGWQGQLKEFRTLRSRHLLYR